MPDNRLDHGGPFLLRGAKNPHTVRRAKAWSVGRYAGKRCRVNRPKLGSDLRESSGHSRKMKIAAEESLVGDARSGLLAMRDLAVFLCLDHLMQAMLPRATFGNASCKLVDDLHLPVDDHVMLVESVEMHRAQCMAYELFARFSCFPNAA